MLDPIKKLGIGSVQFGLDYGVTNTSGKTPELEVLSILQHAVDCRIDTIDTARGYGNSEYVLGKTLAQLPHNFKIVTKLPPVKKEKIDSYDIQFLKGAFNQSLSRLQVSCVDGLLLHHAGDFIADGAERISDMFGELKNCNKIIKCGISAYDQKTIEAILKSGSIDLIQVPINVLDQRLAKSGLLEDLKAHKIEVHVRSAFLQGILLVPSDKIPVDIFPLKEPIETFHAACKRVGQSPSAVALGFLLENDNIDRIICGVNTAQQLKGLCDQAQRYKTLGGAFFENLAFDNDFFLNPANWPQK